MIAVLRALGDGRVEARDLEVGIGRWRPVALHVDEPRRRRTLRHAQRFLQRGAQLARPLGHHLGLVLLAFMVQVVVLGEFWLVGKLEEGIVENLVIDIELSHLRMYPVSALLLQRLGFLLLHDGLTDLRNASGLDEVGKLEGRLLHTALAGHVLALAAPVPGHVHGVAVRLEVHEEPRIGGRRVPHLHNVRPPDQRLQLSHRHSPGDLPLLPGELALRRPLLLVLTVLSLFQQ
mmetsp:Transcript_136776/g.381242  ORF Transcript_136776/g.381242 Transcript_136776/m.381242 type:complete len:233 (+) Transcript_136776:1318-2016(+)